MKKNTGPLRGLQLAILIPFFSLSAGGGNPNGISHKATCYDSRFYSKFVPKLVINQYEEIRITFRNNGTCTWKKGTVRLYASLLYKPDYTGAQWSDEIKKNFGLVDSYAGYTITRDVAVNAEYTFSFRVKVFPSKGDYKIRYQLTEIPGVREFFGDYEDIVMKVADK